MVEFIVAKELNGPQGRSPPGTPERSQLWEAIVEAPACPPGRACGNQSDWIRVRATLIVSEVTWALWQGPRGAWPPLLRRPLEQSLMPPSQLRRGAQPCVDVCERVHVCVSTCVGGWVVQLDLWKPPERSVGLGARSEPRLGRTALCPCSRRQQTPCNLRRGAESI